MKHNQPYMKIVLKYDIRQQNIRYTLYKPIYIYIYVSINSYVHTYIHTYMYLYVNVYVYVYIYIYIHVHSIYIHRYTYTSIYLHTYIYIYILISQNKHRFTPNCKPPISPGLTSRVGVPFLQPSRRPGGTSGDRLTSKPRCDCCGCSYSSGKMRPV